MAEKKTYVVYRAMHGEGRDYARGDEREMTEADAATLVKSGALALKGEVPMERAEPVRHTFGTAKTSQRDFVPAITDADVSDSRVDGRRSPARKG
ncbi:hypothetical protein [Sphingomonas corticis]|jgi:hypothetical protein|uniref:DUF2188 domain-containing protein n=1 Tax=Sphingomonas corticis TaxID=2722791 RepID=A0ABX1CUZ9_9SPHN|nr:hypothetical protein [Sphingomonas corticis]NJR80448.1 hypothetical protein [Sphingomonas corticis]